MRQDLEQIKKYINESNFDDTQKNILLGYFNHLCQLNFYFMFLEYVDEPIFIRKYPDSIAISHHEFEDEPKSFYLDGKVRFNCQIFQFNNFYEMFSKLIEIAVIIEKLQEGKYLGISSANYIILGIHSMVREGKYSDNYSMVIDRIKITHDNAMIFARNSRDDSNITIW